MLLDLYFSALEIVNIEAGMDNLDARDFVISGTVRETSIVIDVDLSKNVKKRKYHGYTQIQ